MTNNGFTWYELMTSDLDAACAFYAKVAGWTVRDSGMVGMDYRIATAPDGVEVAGMMSLPEGSGGAAMPPVWLGYIEVDDVDTAATRLSNAGGHVHRAPTDIPDIGRFALASDPQGATIVLFTPAGDAQGGAPNDMATGHFGWNELLTRNSEAALAFYADQFGWQADTPIDMGPMGQYRLFSIGGVQKGGMMDTGDTPPMWLFYLSVEDLDAAQARATEGGAALLNGPMEVPGGMFVAQMRDPQGAMFALVGPRTGSGE